MRDTNPEPRGNALDRFSVANPILISSALFIIAFFIRLIDSLVLRLDERLGELILTKSLGFVLVVVFVWAAGRKLRDIGLHSDYLLPSLLIGTLTTLFALLIGYSADLLIAAQQGTQPALQCSTIDPKVGVTGGALFALWMVGANIVNSFMEEGLFRGLMIPLFRIKLSFWKTNWLQAIFFSAWHLPWVLKYYQLGEVETVGEIASSVAYNTLPQLFIGLIYGYLFLKTNNLWAPWIAHFLNNTILNVVHVTTTGGIDSAVPIRMTVYMVAIALSMFLVKRYAGKVQLPEAKVWG